MTLPMSAGPEAPVSAIAARARVSISASVSCSGRNSARMATSASSARGAVLATGVAVDLDALAALLHLRGR